MWGLVVADYIRLYVDLFDSDEVQAALTETPYAMQAAVWALTTCGRKRAASFEVTQKRLDGASGRYRIRPEDLEAGLRALNGGLLMFDGATISFPNWQRYQSRYMQTLERKPGVSPTPPIVSPEERRALDAEISGRKGNGKPPQAPPKKRPPKPKTEGPPAEALELTARWNAESNKRGLGTDDTTAPSGQGVKNLLCRVKEGLDWAKAQRCQDRYWQRFDAEGSTMRVNWSNFYGEQARYQTYLPDDWRAPEKSACTVNQSSVSAQDNSGKSWSERNREAMKAMGFRVPADSEPEDEAGY